MPLNTVFMILTAALALLPGPPQGPSAIEILQRSDLARGGGLPGITWKVHLVGNDQDGEQTRDLTIKAAGDNSLAEFDGPAKMKGKKMLMEGLNMWFVQPGLQKPVPISPRQRVAGQASTGDLASTNYAKDYSATLTGEEVVDGKQYYVLNLQANNKSVTYDRIVYWVSKSQMVGTRADFYTVSGKKFKTANFEYDNRIDYESRRIPFVSKMTIIDATNLGYRTVMDYRSATVGSIPASDFNVSLLAK